MKKVWWILIVVVVILGGVGYFTISSETFCCGPDSNFIEGDVLNVGDYSYVKSSNTPSHSCPITWEEINFNLDGRGVRIYSVNARPNEGVSPGISESAECQAEGIPLDLSRYNCIDEQTSRGHIGQVEYTYTCTYDLSFDILNSEKFEVCMSGDNCDLLNGVDVLILTEEVKCSRAEGEWKMLPDGCVDSCESQRRDDISCTLALKDGCDCGEGKCWTGETCEDI